MSPPLLIAILTSAPAMEGPDSSFDEATASTEAFATHSTC